MRHSDVVIVYKEDLAEELGPLGDLEDMSDQPLPASVSRVRLTGEDKDHRVIGVIDDLGESLEVCKEEVRSLVGGKATTKTDEKSLRGKCLEETHQHGGVLIEVAHMCLVATTQILDEATLELQPPLPYILIGSLPDTVPQLETILIPQDALADALLHKVSPRGSHPGRQVDAIGHVAYVKLLGEVSLPDGGKHLPGDLTMQLADAISLLAGIESKDAHGEFLMRPGVLSPKVDQLLMRNVELIGIVTHILREERLIEVVVTGRYRCVAGVETGGAYQLQRLIEVETALYHMRHTLQPHKGSVTLIGMVDIGLDAEETKHLDTTDAEHILLFHTILPVTAIELMGDLSIPLRVLSNVGIHQVELHPPHVHAPDLSRHLVAIEGHTKHQGSAIVVTHQREGQVLKVLCLILSHLLSVSGDLLIKVAVAIEEADTHHIGAEVTRLLDVVACQDPETTGVDLEDIGDPILHAEVGDRGEVVPHRLIHIGPEAVIDLGKSP